MLGSSYVPVPPALGDPMPSTSGGICAHMAYTYTDAYMYTEVKVKYPFKKETVAVTKITSLLFSTAIEKHAHPLLGLGMVRPPVFQSLWF